MKIPSAHKLRNRFFGAKWLVFLVAVVVLIFFGRVTDNKSLSQSLIVVGLGIDHAEKGFTVSAETALVSAAAGGSEAVTTYAVYTALGDTVSDALDDISQQTGLLASLSHCNVLIATKNALLVEQEKLFAPLIETYSLPEQAILVSCEGDPESLLTAKVASAATVPYYIQSALQQNLGASPPVTVKDYAANILSPAACARIPVFAAAEAVNQPQLPDGDGEGYCDVWTTGCLVMTREDGFFLDEDLARVAELTANDDFSDRFSVTLPEGWSAEFQVIKADCSLKADGTDVRAEISLSVSLVQAKGDDGKKATPSSANTQAAAKRLGEDVAEKLRQCFALSLENGADILRLGNVVFRREGYSMPADYLSQLNFSASVTVTVRESS